MIYNYFLKTLSEEEHSLLYMVVYNTIVRSCGFEPDVNYVKFLKLDNTIQQLEKLKNKILPENMHVIESLIKKINEYKSSL